MHFGTIGVDFNIKVFEYDNYRVKLQIWDTAGGERFREIIGSYFRGKDGIFIVFDLSERVTFERLGNWIELCERHSESSVKFLIGNKSDLSENREVSDEEIRIFADSVGMMYFEVSAKTGFGTQECLYKMIEEIHNRKGSNTDLNQEKVVLKKTEIELANESCC